VAAEKGNLTTKDLVAIGEAVIQLSRKLPKEKRTEAWLLPVIYGLTWGHFGPKFAREQRVSRGGSRKRIDFRFNGAASTVFEVAVRDPKHQNQVYGPLNEDELHKLCRETAAWTRALLLIDLSGEGPFAEVNLRKSYSGVRGPLGGGGREVVRVIYVHPDTSFSFLWRPWYVTS
jgi:hypothetical protein